MNTQASELLQKGKSDSAMEFSISAISLSKKINFIRGEADAQFITGQAYAAQAKTTDALKSYESALKLYEKLRNMVELSETYYAMGVLYQRSNYDEALRMFKKALQTAQQTTDKNLAGRSATVIANTLLRRGEYGEAPHYNNLAIQYFTESGNETGLANCLVVSARINHRRGNFEQSTKDNYAALKLYEKAGIKVGMYNVYTGLGLMYEDQKNYPEALNNYLAAKKNAEEQPNKEVLANAYNNVGNAYREMGNSKEALDAYEESLKLAEMVGSKRPIANAHGNIGIIYSITGKPMEALESYNRAIQLYEQIGAREAISIAYLETGKVYFNLKKTNESREWSQKALQLSQQVGYKDVISKSYLLLTQIDTAAGDFASALTHYNLYIKYRDSISNADAARQLAEQGMQYEFSKKEDSMRLQQALIAEQLRVKQAALELTQKEKDIQMLTFLKTQAELQLSNEQKEKQLTIAEQEKALQQSQLETQTLLSKQKEQELLIKDKELTVQRSQRNIWLAGSIAFLLLSFFIFRNYRNQRKANTVIAAEKQKSDNLLLNILPGEVADEIKQHGAAKARMYDNVTVLFTDFVNFTQLSEQLTPEQMVKEIDSCFKAFDHIVENYGMEKIKTIGDSYMAVSGLPVSTDDHAIAAVKAAQEMLHYMHTKGPLFHGEKINMRIGINSGPVVAGIVGIKKFAYDIWGDTVNTAARMEQASEPGRINVSASTFQLISEEFECTYRGKINAKHKGEIDMYFVNDRLQEPGKTIFPENDVIADTA